MRFYLIKSVIINKSSQSKMAMSDKLNNGINRLV